MSVSARLPTRCRGDGYSDTEFGKVRWAQGDVFSLPATSDVTHHASKESTEHGGAAFYWVSDEPLCKYLGVSPTEKKFEPAHYTKKVPGMFTWQSPNAASQCTCQRCVMCGGMRHSMGLFQIGMLPVVVPSAVN